MRVDWPGHMPNEWRVPMAARSLSAATTHFEEGKAALGKMGRGNDPATLAQIALSAAVAAALAIAKETFAQSERHWAGRCRALENRIAALEGRKP